MPLYTDSNYYYSGGSSQLYSPYYPGSASATPTSSGLYSPYTSTYNRAIGGSYVVPISTSRSSSYSSPHGLSSRYQPKLSTITETSSPLMGASRHTTLMPLTRINSPKYTSYSSASAVHAPKYIPPRPILINTADIDVSANRYRQRKEETLRQAQRATDYTSPQSSLKRKNSSEIKVEPQEEQTKKQAKEPTKESSPEQHVNRSTIRRNRAVVRLSTIRSRSKDRNANKLKDEEVPEKKFKDLPKYEPPEDVPFKWREKLADDLAQIPSYPNKKTPGDVLREKYLIQDNKDDENYAAQCRAERLAAGLPKETMEEVIVEIDPLHHTVRRLSIPQCPTFHDICEDISSDKIDDDLNAGALRRRASIIQNQEQEILNELQKSASGTFQMITLERRGSHDSVDLEMPTAHKRHSKRSSKKGKKLRTKITAIVDVENAPVLTTVIPETPEEFDPEKSPKPKFTVNVESVEEHHEIHKVFKLPKKKSIKKIAKVKEQVLPEGFMTPLPKPQVSPKKKFIKPTAEVFTFDEKVQSEIVNDQKPILQTSQSLDEGKKPAQTKILEKANSLNVELKTPTTHTIVESKTELTPLSPKTTTELLKDEKTTSQTSMSVDSASKTLEEVEMKVSTPVKTQENKIESGPLASTSTTELSKAEKITDSPKTLKISTSLDRATKIATSKTLEKSNSVNVEMKTPPATPKTPLVKKETVFPALKSTLEEQKSSPKTLGTSNKTSGQSPLVGENLEEKQVLKTSQSLDNEAKPSLGKTLQKSSSINVELKTPTTPSTPTILKGIIKEDNRETAEMKSLVDTSKTDSKSPYVADKLEDKKILKSSQSLDNEPKLGVGKTLQKSNSINVELKTPKTPTTPTKVLIKETIKEESQATEEVKPLIAKPKPIQKAIMKSDSGEDFWAQIGSRETMYMNKRKKEIVEKQWQKREDLLEATGEEEVKNIEEIKTKVTSQKIEALKKAEQDKQNSKGVVSRSNSNESALKKKSPVKGKEEKKATETEKPDDKPKTPVVTLKDLKSGDTKIKPNDKLENAKTPVVTKMSKETSLSPTTTTTTTSPNTSSPTAKTATTTTTAAAISNTTTPPKIVGQQAKSPEQQEQAEQNKCYPTTQAKNNNNKNEMDINKMAKTNTENNAKEQLAKTFTLPKENTTITATKAKAKAADETTTTAHNVAESTTTKQAETKQINKTTELQNKNNVVTKAKTIDNANKPLTAVAAAAKNDKESPTTKSKAKTSPNAINADQFIAKAPAKTNATSAITGTTTTTTAATAANATSPKNAPTITKTTNKIAAATTTTVAVATNAIGTATATPTDNKDKCKTNDNSKNTDNNNNNDNTTDTGGSNLSKFATVLNLAQCLQDVDAELADYLPSSAEISENEDYSDSDFDYSSIDGWDKLTPSMKKKVKQRHRKEKQAEQARFDPQKKVKIDTTRKLYVKEEAPRFPLVATPRPLWKREKIVYPVDDSDDESDSEESGSTEETEDSDECTTSEEYEDEVSPTASGDGKSGDGKSGSSTDPNKENPSIIRMSTCSNDSGFEGGTAPASPKKMLECDVNCHKKCERLTANLCGVNQKLIVEALANVKRGARETRDSPSTPPSSNPAYKIEATEEQDETSYTYSQFQKSGRFTPPATIIPRFKNYSVDDFHFLAVLGKGSFGKVLLAELRDTTYYYAVKCLKKDVVLEDDDVDSTLIERKVLALGTKHPYLCHLFCTFQTESHLFFVMEYLNGGDLMFHIQESGRFTEERARFYGAEIVSGLKFLHKKGIIYRDLKLDNVLLDYEGHVRIADFGMCKLQIYLDKTADSFCGTPDYMAPEIIKGDKYNQNVDWWSFGVLLYEMLIGQSPFSGCDEDELFWSICNELPWFPVYISAEATSILKGLLEKDHTKRIGSHYSPAGDIVEHIFFRPIDWNLLEKRQIEPPFRPQVKHPLDTQYFDRVFTKERVRLTPIDKDILQSMDQKQFLGFTYTNPHITLD